MATGTGKTVVAFQICWKQGIVHSNPEIMGGTRVPLQNLIDYLEGGESIENFLDAFPTVKREQAIAVIEAGKLTMLTTV